MEQTEKHEEDREWGRRTVIFLFVVHVGLNEKVPDICAEI